MIITVCLLNRIMDDCIIQKNSLLKIVFVIVLAVHVNFSAGKSGKSSQVSRHTWKLE